jgi:hypothetical protein
MLRDGQKKSACCLEPCPRGNMGDRDLQFQRISGKLSLVDCTSILPIGTVSEPSFLPEQTFWCPDLAPNGALRTNATRLVSCSPGDLCFGKLQGNGVSRKAWLRLTRFVRRTTTKRGA